MEETWEFNDKSFVLQRRPGETSLQTLRAWNSSDEYLLQQFAESKVAPDASVLVVQDHFGALALHTWEHKPLLLTDSLMAEQVTKSNLQANGIDPAGLQFTDPLTFAAEKRERPFDVVLLKIPRQREYLRMLLHIIRPHLNENTLFLAAGMVKHVAPDARKDMADIIGASEVMRVWKKAIVIRCTFEPNRIIPEAQFRESFKLPELDRTLCAWPSVFAAGKLDMGTRLLMEFMPSSNDVKTIADLGCGSGVLSIAAARTYPAAKIIAVDESALAVASLRAGLEQNSDLEIAVHRADGLGEFEDSTFDLVICNPPFHAEAALSLSETTRLLPDVARALTDEGEFRMVGRTSMPYVRHLSEYFNEVETVTKRSGFSIISARKPRR